MNTNERKSISIAGQVIGNGHPLAFILGPCVIESETSLLTTAEGIARATENISHPVIFKASYLKANRTSIRSFSGLEFEAALGLLARVKTEFNLPLLTDVHTVQEVGAVAEIVDCLQIPAFLCRQTELIVAAAETGLPLNVKKGQFLSPGDAMHVAEKAAMGAGGVMFTERGTVFGYGDLVVDFRGLTMISRMGFPVCFDASHSVQKPGAADGRSGGAREFLLPLARAATATGIDALFCEVHHDPDSALSDKDTQWPLKKLPELLEQVLGVDRAVRQSGATV